MIAILNQSNELVRVADLSAGEIYGFHRRFGFVSEETAKGRRKIAERMSGDRPAAATSRDEWLFRFRVATTGFEPKSGCRIEPEGGDKWRLQADHGTFYLTTTADLDVAIPPLPAPMRRWQTPVAALIIALLVATGIGIGTMTDEVVEEEDKLVEALEAQKVVVVPQVKVATTPPPAKIVQQKPKTSGAASQNNLGFLKLLGRKELTKAVGGMPLPAAEKSPGVGKGGKQGSGGELLTGLGQGMKRTTVGNTGVAGLGGIGNAGAGGGEGGFGSAYISAGGTGGGKILAEGDLGKEMVLDGGLDRVVIQATIAKYLSQVRACYERGLRKNPGLTGQVLMDFEIAATGKLNYSRVKKTSLANKEVEDCVAKVMTSWQFPKPVGGTMVKVSYPFTFKPTSYM